MTYQDLDARDRGTVEQFARTCRQARLSAKVVVGLEAVRAVSALLGVSWKDASRLLSEAEEVR